MQFCLAQLSQAAIDLIKTDSLSDGTEGAAGDTVAYQFDVTNTGNVTLANIELTDELEGPSDITHGDWPADPGVWTPGETVTASATYDLTQSDVDAGHVDNTAVVTATPPSDDPIDDGDDATVPVDGQSGLDLIKTGELSRGANSGVGDEMVYNFTVTNTGTVTLTDVSIIDELGGLSEVAYCEWPHESGVLAPGEAVTASTTYQFTPGRY